MATSGALVVPVVRCAVAVVVVVASSLLRLSRPRMGSIPLVGIPSARMQVPRTIDDPRTTPRASCALLPSSCLRASTVV